MAFREVGVHEIREVLRLWVRGEGLRSITPAYVVSLGEHRNSHGQLVLLVCQSRGYRSQQVHAPAYGSVHALEHLPGPRLKPACSCRRRSQGWRQDSAAQPDGRRISWWQKTNRSRHRLQLLRKSPDPQRDPPPPIRLNEIRLATILDAYERLAG